MAPKNSNATPQKEPQTVESVVSPLSEHAQAATKDTRVRDVLDSNLKLATGLASVFLAPQDGDDQLAATLTRRNITLEDAQNLVADTVVMLDAQQEREARDVALRAATTKLDAGRGRAHDQGQKLSNLIRGLVGSKSDALARFGIPRAGKGGKKGPRAPKKNGNGSDSTPAK